MAAALARQQHCSATTAVGTKDDFCSVIILIAIVPMYFTLVLYDIDALGELVDAELSCFAFIVGEITFYFLFTKH